MSPRLRRILRGLEVKGSLEALAIHQCLTTKAAMNPPAKYPDLSILSCVIELERVAKSIRTSYTRTL